MRGKARQAENENKKIKTLHLRVKICSFADDERWTTVNGQQTKVGLRNVTHPDGVRCLLSVVRCPYKL